MREKIRARLKDIEIELENKRFEREDHRPPAPVDEFNALFR